MAREEKCCCRTFPGGSGILMLIPSLYPAAAPLQVVCLIRILWLGAERVIDHRGMLTAGMHIGVACTLQMIVLRSPPPLAAILTLVLTVLMTVFAFGSSQLIRILAIFLAGAVLLAALGHASCNEPLPNPFERSTGVASEFLSFFVCWTGLILA